MENKGLLFIPDISGFSRFVSETEIDHSSLIIRELLEILINSNDLGLNISEVEGDAILFYKFGDPPALKDLYKQVEKMFVAFHRNIAAYEHRRYCQCKACVSAANLTLKIITHYGEFTQYNVKNFNKLIGKDLIIAHQLLKNDIGQHEYWLVTQSLLADKNALVFEKWMQWSSSHKHTDSGDVSFLYTQLSQLKKELLPEFPTVVDFKKLSKVFSAEREYATDLITLFHATGDVRYRNRWDANIIGVEEVSHYLPRVGTKCLMLTNNGTFNMVSSDYSYSDTRIQFCERDDDSGAVTRYTLSKTGTKRTKLFLDYYLKSTLISKLFFKLIARAKFERTVKTSMEKLDSLVRELKIPSAADC
jgi:hypothetical protein